MGVWWIVFSERMGKFTDNSIFCGALFLKLTSLSCKIETTTLPDDHCYLPDFRRQIFVSQCKAEKENIVVQLSGPSDTKG